MSAADRLLSIPLIPEIDELLGSAAKRVHRSKASFVRWCFITEMQRMGMLDANLNPIPADKWPTLEEAGRTLTEVNSDGIR